MRRVIALGATVTALSAAATAQARTSVATGRWQGSAHGTTIGFVVSRIHGTLVLSNLTAHCDDSDPDGPAWDVAGAVDSSGVGEAAIDSTGAIRLDARPVAHEVGGALGKRMGRLRNRRGVIDANNVFSLPSQNCATQVQLNRVVVTRHHARELRNGKYTVVGTGETASFHLYGDGSVLVWRGDFKTPIGGDPDQPELNCADLAESAPGTGLAVFPGPSGSFAGGYAAGSYGYVDSANVLGRFVSDRAGVGGWQASSVSTIACTGAGALAFKLTRPDPALVAMHAPHSVVVRRRHPRPSRTPRIVRYVALGDSYSSGEGVPPYEPGTDTSRDRCHRSTRAYSQRLRLSGVRLERTSYACSGATTANVRSVKRYGESAQLSHRALKRAQLVTITIGGNDAAFSSVIALCARAAPGRCYQGAGERRIVARLRSLKTQLRATFARIRRSASRARVVVLDYPNLFPAAGASCKKLNTLYSAPARAFIRRLGGELDDEIETAARSAHAQFVDVRDAFATHEICSTHEWVNFLVRHRGGVSRASFHPTPAGQASYARTLARALHGFH